MPGVCICQGFISQEAGWRMCEVGTTLLSPRLPDVWGLEYSCPTEAVLYVPAGPDLFFILQPLDIFRDFSLTVSVGCTEQLVISEG